MKMYRVERKVTVKVYDYISAKNEEILKAKIEDMDSLIGEISNKAKLSDSHAAVSYSEYEENYELIDENLE